MYFLLCFLIRFLKGLLTAAFFALNTIFWCCFLYPFVILKFLIPSEKFGAFCANVMVAIGEIWISCNGFALKWLQNIKWEITGLDSLSYDRSYLVCANHQAWVDILVLQRVFNRKIPFLRFFLKHELIYVPLLGAAWWALDFPFMMRYSKSYLEKHPEKRGKDLESTQKACERFHGKRISILNFLEGTRFTKDKHAKQNSPYKQLLKPKTGGIAFVIEAMGDQFHSLLDVTLEYPRGPVSIWGLLSGKLDNVVVHVEEIPIPHELLNGHYLEDNAFRQKMQNWIHQIWLRKDLRIKSKA